MELCRCIKEEWDYWLLIDDGDVDALGGGDTQKESQDRFTGLEGGCGVDKCAPVGGYWGKGGGLV